MAGLGLQPIDDEHRLGGPAATPGDAIGRLKQHLDRLRRDATREFDIPGYGGDLIARYKRLPPETVTERLYGTEGSWAVKNAEYLIAACELIGQRDTDGKLTQIDGTSLPGYAGLELLVGQHDDVAAIVLAVFAGDERALCDHAEAVEQWMASVAALEAEDLLGGS